VRTGLENEQDTRGIGDVKARSLFCCRAVRELGLTQPAVSISVKRGQAIADENGFQLLDE